jgi:hypothetical protein
MVFTMIVADVGVTVGTATLVIEKVVGGGVLPPLVPPPPPSPPLDPDEPDEPLEPEVFDTVMVTSPELTLLPAASYALV